MTPEAIGTMVGAGLAVLLSAYATLGHRATSRAVGEQVSEAQFKGLSTTVEGLGKTVDELKKTVDGMRDAVTPDTFATFSASVQAQLVALTKSIGEVTGEVRAWRGRNSERSR